MLWKLKQRHQKWLEGERGTVFKDWGGKIRIALAFPNRYGVLQIVRLFAPQKNPDALRITD